MTVDLYAEHVVAACAAASRHGAELAHERLDAADFTSRTFAAVFTASVDVDDAPMPTDLEASTWARTHLAGEDPASIWPSELRLAEIARRVQAPVEHIVQLVARRPVAEDITGKYANRVLAAARQRRLQETVVELHELVTSPDDALGSSRARAEHVAERVVAQLAEAER